MDGSEANGRALYIDFAWSFSEQKKYQFLNDILGQVVSQLSSFVINFQIPKQPRI